MTDITTATAANAKVAQIVEGLLAKRGGQPARDLTDTGLTSLEMVNLMLAIEAEFDIEIPSSMLKPENFRSIAAIDAMVKAVAAG
jgi:acyl carrier protein